MKKWAPALKASLSVLRLAAAVTQVVTGLPIPIPNGFIDEHMAVEILFGELSKRSVFLFGELL